MMKLVAFKHGFIAVDEQNECIVLRRTGHAEHIEISFPFFDDMHVIRLTACEALNLRNALNELAAPHLLQVTGE
ncbi:hypothetical protein [Paenibacillus sp. 481]|uniref:hypothetical protein n=1 Tax=Paenibacillus sp. 481 TaxID=2835869 RepID=UPI001E4F763B|nr:hypothetical protein [Paenibacillus sp. 481]UHA74433.1 hypothetical protein KIK04_04820 [Paenibacillus sp. 481]